MKITVQIKYCTQLQNYKIARNIVNTLVIDKILLSSSFCIWYSEVIVVSVLNKQQSIGLKYS